MNILFVGPYRQGDEWGRKSRSILRAIQKTGHSVTSRPIFLSSNPSYNSYMEKCEFNISEHYDILIQFLLQPYAVYEGRVSKRIGIFNTETLPTQMALGQLTKELLMDEVWTDSLSIQDGLQNSLDSYKGDVKVVAIPPTLDTTDLPEQSSISIRSSDRELEGRFLFYYIGNITEEKGAFKETCVAFMNAFSNSDQVALIVAPEVPVLEEELNGIMEGCRASIGEVKHPSQHPLIKVINSEAGLQISERIAIHIDSDCMVFPGYSLSTNSLVLEAAMYKNTPIVNKGNACYEWWGEENLWGVESYEELCVSRQRPLPYRFTSGEVWHKPIIKSLSRTMRDAYVDKFKRDKKIKANSKLRDHFNKPSLEVL
jgi:glycosyltransferase involved in cell wall biosynthesis